MIRYYNSVVQIKTLEAQVDDDGSRGRFWVRLRENRLADRLTGGRRRLVLAVLPMVAVLLAVTTVVIVTAGGAGDGASEVEVRAPLTVSPTASARATRTPASAGLLTPIPVSPGEQLTAADLAARGAGLPTRGEFTGARFLIPKLGIDAPFTVRTVGDDGRMPNPQGPEDVAWYDFSRWDGLGGLPGKGGNVIVAGHVDYINVGPAVFWDVRTLQPGDRVQIRLTDGNVVEYAIEFNKRVDADNADWTAIVAATGDESVTLITCVGQFVNGGYTERQVAWGRRVG
jgi:LPXTG-site transpeptidase (sortase) family protein